MLFCIYGLQLDAPKEYQIILWKGSMYHEGTVDIMEHGGKLIKMDWNDLSRIITKFSTPEEFFISNIKKVKEDRDVVDFKLENFPWEGGENHEYYFHKLSYKVVRKFPRKEFSDYIIGLGVFCHNSNRFIVLQYRPPEKGNDLDDKALEIISSFRCRCTEP
ncbi:MAG: hypothetical protein ACUVQ5_06225 [Candidatus Methanomethylicaceae archaeon]